MNTKIIACGTSGYLDFLKNFYKNLKQLGIAHHLKIFCLDDEAFHQMNSYARDARVIRYITDSPSEMVEFGSDGYHLIMEDKLKIVSQEIEKYDYILYSDTDVFFNRDPLPYIEDLVVNDRNDVLFMLDWNGDMCGGFFVAKNCKNCRDLFKPSSVKGLKDSDQTLINNRLQMYPVRYNILDAKLFVNGPLWKGGVSGWSRECFAVHYNAMPQLAKIEAMKRYKHWLLP